MLNFSSEIRNKILIFQDILTKFYRIVQKPQTIWMLFPDYSFLILIGWKISNFIFYNNGEFLFLSFFERAWPKIKNIKKPNFWRSTGQQPLKIASHLYAACKKFSLMENQKQAPNFLDHQQLSNFFVFNRSVKSRRTKYVANYFERFVMWWIKATLNCLHILNI
jgi:hypothetical protein